MSALTRWDPIREATALRDAMNQRVEQAIMRPGFGSAAGWSGGMVGQLNVLEQQGKYYCQVLLSGVNRGAIDLTVRQNTLTIAAKMPELLPEGQQKEATYLVREFGSGEFSRSITFPKDVNGDAVEAHFERSILTSEIPLAEHARPKRIRIHEAAKTSAVNNQHVVEEDARKPGPAQIG